MANAAEKRHLARVVALGCVICGGPAVPHHPRGGTSSGMGMKASDYEAIPLCNLHHTDGGYGVAIHAGQKKWEENFGAEADFVKQVQQELGIER